MSRANVVLPVTVFRENRSTFVASLFGCFDPKVVAMLAEIFIIRSQAQARLMEEVIPSSKSAFIPLCPRGEFTFKETRRKGAEAASGEQPIKVVR
jgi:hypothetical protein